jgi:Chemotaxis protein histidine kinase and related kinases
MNEVEKPDYATLRWVKEGLDETIQLARQALEAYEEAGFQGDAIGTFLERVHQLLGTLRMVQVYGGAMLVEEMEQVGRLLEQGALEGSERLAESLMLGLVQLPGYLERLEKGEPDIPLVLLPVLNDLRAARGVAPASEVVLYAPNLNRVVEREPVIPGSGNADIPALVKQQRTRYHHGLLAWYRGEGEEEGLQLVLDVVRRVNAVAGTRRLRRLMDSAEALVITLVDGEFAANDEVKQLFSRLDRVFKMLIEKGEEASMEQFPMDLLKNILYFVSRSHSTDPVVQSVKRTADLANSFPEQIHSAAEERPTAADGSVLAAVSAELLGDLGLIQEGLDLYIRGDREELERLRGLADRLHKVADTLGMLGKGMLREKLLQVVEVLAEIESGRLQPDDDQLMQIATNLVQAESALGGGETGGATGEAEAQGPEAEREARDRAVIQEASVEFSRIKEGLERYLHDFSESGRLHDVAGDVHKLAGVFSVIDLEAVAGLLKLVEPELERLAEGELELTPQQRGALVDFFAALDYYLEARLDGRSNLDEILDQASASLRRLTTEAEAAEGEVHPEFMEEPERRQPVDAKVIPLYGDATGLEQEEPEEEPRETEEAVDEEPVEPAAVVAEERGEEEVEAEAEAEEPAEEPSALVEMDEIDPEIFDIFMEEAGEELEVINEQYPKWRADLSDENALQTFRRSFHTLKGSGRMVGAMVIGEFAWAVENLLNRIMDGTVPADPEVLAYLDEAVAAVPVLVEAQRTGTPARVDVAALQARGFELAEPRERVEETPAEEVAEEAGEFTGEVPELPPPAIVLDEDLHSIFHTESENHLEVLEQFLDGCDEGCQVTGEVVRALHTLRGSSHLAEVEPMAVLAGEMEIYCNHLHQLAHNCGAEELDLIREFHAVMNKMLGAINRPGSELPDWEALVEVIRAADRALPEVVSDLEPVSDSELLQEPAPEREIVTAFMEEAAEILERLDVTLQQWLEGDGAGAPVEEMRRDVHTLKGGARMAGLTPLGDLAQGLEAFFEALEQSGGEVDPDTRQRVRRLVEVMEDALDALHLNGKLPDLTARIAEAGELAAGMEALVPAEELEESEELIPQEPESILLSEGWEGESEYHPESASLPGREETPPPAQEEPTPVEPAVDPELLELFLEEAGEITERLEEHLGEWEQEITSSEAIDGLMRNLHTLKGNARFAGLFAMGDLSHALESLFENLAEGGLQPDERLVPLVRQGVDRLENSIELLQRNSVLPDLADITGAIESAAAGRPWELPAAAGESELTAFSETSLTAPSSEMSRELSSLQQEQDSSLILNSQVLTDSELLGETELGGEERVIPFPAESVRKRRDRQRPPPLRAEEEQADKGERVRVLAELLDQLVNNAGEVSIYRARLERQNMRVQHNLEELNTTISRLRAQLRALELETEAQIRSRHEREQEDKRYEDFDPLEMDRYSTLQQLSRALSETISDLSNIGESLSEQMRDADTLLLQQARVTNDLQDGLLRSRMVPFKRQASRLQRVVRQTAHTLGKKAELDVIGAEGEIDRTILNRIMGPLEHLLRNAVAHGIEPPQKREELGKPRTGKVSLVLAREGSEVVLTISDDGAGLDAAAIRRKAVQNGLLEEQAEVDEETLYQFILQPGFTTAAEVTQVAGRGVGMDAVVAEIKQLGGSLEIMSQQGRGSSFVIRLPFTLAISEALLVEVAEDVYAIPHGSTEVIIRVSREDLLACYQGRSEGIEYGGHLYPVRYLGSLLGIAEPVLPDNAKWLPLLLVRAGEQRMAIQLDRLIGNQQVVVKSIGAQLAGVRWFTGGTILADGKIALLLDMNAVVRSAAMAQATVTPAVPEEEERGITVMVVDDSITVRKVTSRLLERHNMQVLTAKDGVDAITVLQDRKPDVMLLDIEMPRMDGYELARHIRNTPELEDIPIIMITSRTGEKHRNRALELGVDRYLGKPYQETDLLENIYELLGERVYG